MIPVSTILIGDDHPLVQAALEGALTQVIPGLKVLSAGTLDEVAEVIRSAEEPLDLVLLDLNMPGSIGFTGLFLLQAEFPTVPVAILSAEQDPVTVHRALAYGASGYIPKSIDLRQMAKAILLILNGEIWSPCPLDPASMPDDDDDTPRRFASLTPQQLRILARLVEGKLNKQIAAELQVAEQTIKVHVSTILRKLGVTTRTQAAILAERLTRRDHSQRHVTPRMD